MPRRRYRRYDEYDSWYDRRRRRGGCWYRLTRFVVNVGIALLCMLAGFLLIGAIYLAYTYRVDFQTILLVIIGAGLLILAIALLKWVIEMIVSMVNAISVMRVRATQARKAKVELSRRTLERDAYRQHLQQPPRSKRMDPAPSPEPSAHEPLVRRIEPAHEPQKSGVPGMPRYTQVSYQDIERKVQPGQLVGQLAIEVP